MRKILAVTLVATMILMSGCGKADTSTVQTTEKTEQTEKSDQTETVKTEAAKTEAVSSGVSDENTEEKK